MRYLPENKRSQCRLQRPARPVLAGITSAVMFAAFLVDCVVWYKAGKINAATAGHPAELGPHAVASSRTPEHAGQHPEAEPLKQAP